MMCRIKSLHRHEVRKGLKGSRPARIEDGQVKPQLNTDHQGGSHTDSTVFIVQRRATVITAFVPNLGGTGNMVQWGSQRTGKQMSDDKRVKHLQSINYKN